MCEWSNHGVKIVFRIPGHWTSLEEVRAGLPEDINLLEDRIVLADGTELECFAIPADEQFPQIFRASCRRLPEREERQKVGGYTLNVGLIGEGGSLLAARQLMKAAAAIVQAGGAGVFIDNSGLAHGGQHWMEMASDGGPDAVSYAFVTVVRGLDEVWTMGFQALGLADLRMSRQDSESDPDAIIDIIRWMAAADQPFESGDLLADDYGTSFRVVATTCSRFEVGSPMHNPFGYLRLERVTWSVRDN